MRLKTAAMNAAFSSLVLVPSVIRSLEPEGGKAALRERMAGAEPVGRIDRLHLNGGNLWVLVQDLGGQIARSLG